jgi:hypothetical protein
MTERLRNVPARRGLMGIQFGQNAVPFSQSGLMLLPDPIASVEAKGKAVTRIEPRPAD